MLSSAQKENNEGRTVSVDFVFDSGRPIQNVFQMVRLNSDALARNAHVNPSDIIQAKPEISVIDELTMLNQYNRRPLYQVFKRLNRNNIAIYSSTNLIHVASINQRCEKEARICSDRTIDDSVFLMLGKLIFIDIEPSLLQARYKQSKLFPQHSVEFKNLFSLEQLTACRSICYSFLEELDSEQYEIIQITH